MKKQIIMTGCSSGLGYELSKLFIENNYEVIGISRNKPDIDLLHIETDLTNDFEIDQTIKIIESKYNNFDAIFFCAGNGYIEKMNEIDKNHTEEIFRLNLFSQIYLFSGLLELIKNNGSDIISVGATIGYKANEFMPLYSISKWGLRGFIENARNELKNYKSRVINIVPGGLDGESNIGPKGREALISKIIGKQIGSLISTEKLAMLIFDIYNLPKNTEVSEIIINRK